SIEVEGVKDLEAKGNIVDHEYRIERDATTWPRSPSAGSGSGTPTASRPPRRERRADPRGRSLHRPDVPRLKGAVHVPLACLLRCPHPDERGALRGDSLVDRPEPALAARCR